MCAVCDLPTEWLRGHPFEPVRDCRAVLPCQSVIIFTSRPVFSLCHSLPRTLLLKSDDYWMLTLEITQLKGWAQWVFFGGEGRILHRNNECIANGLHRQTVSDVGKRLNCWNLPSSYIWPTVMTHKLERMFVRLWESSGEERELLPWLDLEVCTGV